ncbi:hypothetical protein DV702_01155 [Sporosarcina sp. PTS2304]|nr:hypothetical protein DV702_01155 [Sporosarcina sp. PTS2304]
MRVFKYYVCLGAASLAERIIEKWHTISGQQPRLIFDSDKSKEGKSINGVQIFHTSKLKEMICSNETIIITSSFVDEIVSDLEKLEITNNILDYKTFDFLIVQQNLLNKNNKLKDKYQGERCFVVGNGPSLNNQDLSYLKDEETIMMNNFQKNEELVKLNSKYWMLADPAYWDKEETRDMLLIPILETLDERLKNTTLFMPQESIVNISNLNRPVVSDKVNFYYMDIDRSVYTEDEKIVDLIDFTRRVPPYSQNVLSPSLMLAMHLGFKEIYIIGCDHSWWDFSEKDIETTYVGHHYNKSEKDMKHSMNIFKSLGYEGLRRTIDRQLYEYNKLNEYAISNDIKIYNATEGGLLENFERIDYNSIFNK